MKRKVRITRMPNLKSGAEVKLEGLRAGLGFNANVMPWPIMAGKMSAPDVEVNQTLKPVPRDQANLEAERGEIAMTPGAGGIPDTFKIGGKRHYQGGTPLNLPDDSFIFSDTAKMKIKDPTILAQFGMSIKKGGYTPAEIAKKYNINDYKKVLADSDTDDLRKKTSEQMIANYNLKLAKLALLQESMKGFPQGIPKIAMPYIEEMNIDPSQFVQMNPGQGDDETSEGDNMTAAYGGVLQQLQARKYGGIYDQYEMAYGGLPKAQVGTNTDDWNAKSGHNDKSKGYWDRVLQNTKSRTFWGDQPRDPRLDEAMEKLIPFYGQDANFMEWLRTLAHTGQYTANELLTGYYENPLATYKRYHKEPGTAGKLALGLGTDIYLYPELVGKLGEQTVKGVVKAAPYIGKTVTKVGQTVYNIASKYASKYLPKIANKAAVIAKIADRLMQASYHIDENTTPEDVHELIQPEIETAQRDQTQVSLKAPINTNNIEPTDTTGLSKFLNKKAFGGETNLPIAQNGSIIKRDSKFILYEDGTVINIQSGKIVRPGNPNWKPVVQNTPPPIVQVQPAPKPKAAPKVQTQPSTTTTTTSTGEPEILITPWKGDAFASKYSPEEWRKFAKAVGFKPKTNTEEKQNAELQDWLTSNPTWAPTVIGLHKKHGMPKYSPTTYRDAKLGLRWDEIKDAIEAQIPKEKEAAKPAAGPTETPKTKEEVTSPYVSHLENLKLADNSDAPWWLQDVIGIANAATNYATVKPYYPWQATAPVTLPDVTFYDPRREIAANEEQQNVATQALSQFAAPQQFNARVNQLQAEGAKNTADILGKYNTMNVNLANQQSVNNAAYMNADAKQRAQEQTGLFDKYTIVNQNYDNAKKQAKDALVKQYTQGITNRAYTQALNELYPQFAIDPSSGGMPRFHDPRSLRPDYSKEKTLSDYYNEVITADPNLKSDPENAWKTAVYMMKMSKGDTSVDPWTEYSKTKGIVPSYQSKNESQE